MLTIQERLKDLRVERSLTLEQLAEQTGLSRSALGSYESDEFKDISHYALVRLAKFYGVTADFLLGLAETRNHPNAALAELRLSDGMIELLQSGKIDNALLCELATHPDFPRLMAELEVYVNGMAVKLVQTANAFVCVLSIRNPQNRKENSPLSDWDFPIIRKELSNVFSGLCPDPPLVGEAGKQHWLLSPNRVIRVASVKGCPDASRPAYCPLTPLPLRADGRSAS